MSAIGFRSWLRVTLPAGCLAGVTFLLLSAAAPAQSPVLVELASASRLPPVDSPSAVQTASVRPAKYEAFLFHNGQYVAPPYQIQCQSGEVRINGLLLRHSAGDWNRLCSNEGSVTPPADRELLDNLRAWLASPCLLVSLADQPLIPFRLSDDTGAELLNSLTDDQRDSAWLDVWEDKLPQETDRAKFQSWLIQFTPTEELTQRARNSLQALDRLMENHNAKSTAVQRLNLLAYPLTMGGMLLCVFSIGHLMIYRPEPGAGSYDVDTSAMSQRMVTVCIGLVIVLSGLDLLWTILATQAGQMREMNPIGSQLIDNPWALGLYKVAATGLAAGLFYAFRKYRRIQMATWWACLTLTLLTVRWVAIHSLMMG